MADPPERRTVRAEFSTRVEPRRGWSIARVLAAFWSLLTRPFLALWRRLTLSPVSTVTISGVAPPDHLLALFMFAQERDNAQTVATLNEAVAAYEAIRADSAFTDTSPSFRATVATNAGVGYSRRYGSQGNEEDYRRANDLLQEALALLPAARTVERRVLFGNLVGLARNRFERTDSDDDLDAAIEWHRQFLTCEPDQELRLDTRDYLIGGLVRRLQRQHRPDDEELLIEVVDDAIADRATPRGAVLNYLEIAFAVRSDQWRRTQGRVEAEKIVQVLDRIITIAGRKHPEYAKYVEHRENARQLVELLKKVRR